MNATPSIKKNKIFPAAVNFYPGRNNYQGINDNCYAWNFNGDAHYNENGIEKTRSIENNTLDFNQDQTRTLLGKWVVDNVYDLNVHVWPFYHAIDNVQGHGLIPDVTIAKGLHSISAQFDGLVTGEKHKGHIKLTRQIPNNRRVVAHMNFECETGIGPDRHEKCNRINTNDWKFMEVTTTTDDALNCP